ncbi:MAG: hypothetical protein EDM05_030420 [Leptolyngbya sp. IPPAS B-1204]|nr:hypothetical protein [Elainella sp. C42_A2020_010]RNJ64837.1 MAG: hypothetical protein EDM05_34355 [Leptolyngbya sp. IPPAS B-1204]
MAAAAVKLIRLRCENPQDNLTDEVKMQQDGRQIWPNRDDGYFSISTGNEVPLNLVLAFDTVTRITLYDDEDLGSDDNLGTAEIFDYEAGGERTKDIAGPGSLYRLTYIVKTLDF